MAERKIIYLERGYGANRRFWVPELSWLAYSRSDKMQKLLQKQREVAAAKPEAEKNISIAIKDIEAFFAAKNLENPETKKGCYYQCAPENLYYHIKNLYNALDTLGIPLPPPVDTTEIKFWVGKENSRGEWKDWLAEKTDWLPERLQIFKRWRNTQAKDPTPAGWIPGSLSITLAPRSSLDTRLRWINRFIAIIISFGMAAVIMSSAITLGLSSFFVAILAPTLLFAQYSEKQIINAKRFPRLVNFFKTIYSELYPGSSKWQLMFYMFCSCIITSVVGIQSFGIFKAALPAMMSNFWLAAAYVTILSLHLTGSLIDHLFLKFGWNRRLPTPELVVNDLETIESWQQTLTSQDKNLYFRCNLQSLSHSRSFTASNSVDSISPLQTTTRVRSITGFNNVESRSSSPSITSRNSIATVPNDNISESPQDLLPDKSALLPSIKP